MKVVFEGLLPEDRPQLKAQTTSAPRAPRKPRVQLRLISASAPLFHAL